MATAGVRRHLPALSGLVGVLGYGVGAYVFLVAAGRVLGPARFADLSLLWTAVFLGVVGLLVPVEQEGARAVGTAVAMDEPVAPVEAEVRASAVSVGGASAAACLVAGPVLADHLFGGHLAFVAVLAGALVAYGFVHGARAILVGTGRLGRFSALLLLDTGARLVLTAGILLAGFRSGLALASAVAVSPVVALAVVAPRTFLLRRTPGGWVPLLRRISPMVVAAVVGQVAVSYPALAARALEGAADEHVVGSFLAALSLARAPILLFGAFEAAMVPTLTAHVAHGRTAAVRGVMARYVAVVAAVGAVATAVGTVALPPVLRAGFGARYEVDVPALAVVLAGTGAALVTLVLGQGLLTLHRRRALAIPWTVALVVEVAATAALGGDLPDRVALAYLLGNLASAVAGGLLLRAALRSGAHA